MSPTRSPDLPLARAALRAAFAELALARRWSEITVDAIVRRAGVARSTFYYHFRGRDDLLLANLAPFIDALASMALQPAPSPELQAWLVHIWEKRVLGGRLLERATGRRIEAAVAGATRKQLPTGVRADALAAQIAGATLALLRAWIGGRAMAKPDEMAAMLWQGARAMLRAEDEAGEATNPNP